MTDWAGNDAVLVTDSDEADVIAALEGFTPLSIQSAAQAGTTPATNTGARLLYASSTRTQGNFSLFYGQAKRDIVKDQVRFNVTIPDEDMALALAYLIWHYGIKKFPDWEAKSVNSGGDSVSREKAGMTSAKAAYLELLKAAKKGNQSTPKIGKVADAEYYDARLKPANIDPGYTPED
jgi:hypothetical protein